MINDYYVYFSRSHLRMYCILDLSCLGKRRVVAGWDCFGIVGWMDAWILMVTCASGLGWGIKPELIGSSYVLLNKS